jgi:AraC-like DNA-binding protein
LQELVGVAPMTYLARRRTQLATELMRDRGLSPSEVAPRVGYGSVAAFSRAYKRTRGIPPGAVRRGRRANERWRSQRFRT